MDCWKIEKIKKQKYRCGRRKYQTQSSPLLRFWHVPFHVFPMHMQMNPYSLNWVGIILYILLCPFLFFPRNTSFWTYFYVNKYIATKEILIEEHYSCHHVFRQSLHCWIFGWFPLFKIIITNVAINISVKIFSQRLWFLRINPRSGINESKISTFATSLVTFVLEKKCANLLSHLQGTRQFWGGETQEQLCCLYFNKFIIKRESQRSKSWGLNSHTTILNSVLPQSSICKLLFKASTVWILILCKIQECINSTKDFSWFFYNNSSISFTYLKKIFGCKSTHLRHFSKFRHFSKEDLEVSH